uniref:MFS transporter n=1 Tax=candidate division WOR-3 bacterium TaxID=2052148 RepID=A0A7C6EGZ7_UNCW3
MIRKQLRSVLKIRNFVFLTLSGTLSQFGDRLTHMLLITIIEIAQPGRVLAFSFASLTFNLPVIILAPLAGVLVDHWSKRRIMIRVHFIQAGLLLVTPFIIRFTKGFQFFWIAMIIFFGLDIFNNTAKPALLPAVVAKRKLLTANSIDQFLSRFATVFGMVVGGFLIRWAGWHYGIMIDALMHFSAGLLAIGIFLRYEPRLAISQSNCQSEQQVDLGIPSPEERRLFLLIKNAWKIFFADVKEVLILVVKDRLVLLVMTSIWISVFVAGVAYTILIYLVQQVLKLGTPGVGLFSGVLAVGMILGALILGLLELGIDKPKIVVTGIMLYGILFLFGQFLIKVWFMALIAILSGVIFSWITIAQNTILQEKVMAKIRGRIFSTKEFFGCIAFIITTFVIGSLGDLTSVRITLAVVGIFLLIVSGLGFFLLKKIESERR